MAGKTGSGPSEGPSEVSNCLWWKAREWGYLEGMTAETEITSIEGTGFDT